MRYRAILAYDGSAYQGWQSQAEGATLQDAIERVLGMVFREAVRVTASGRTDAGVHARGQVIAFEAAAGFDDRMLRSINAVLPPDIVFRELAPAAASFDPRRDAVMRAYRYRIWNASVPSPFELRYAWHVRERLDVPAMAAAAELLIGEHDFASFQGADHVPRASVRRVYRSAVSREGELVIYDVEANSFARHMVRNVVGQLVEIGRGWSAVGEVDRLLDARDRRLAASPAPPRGLFLEWVRYP